MYAGGLDTREDSDGHYTIHWRSVSTQVRSSSLKECSSQQQAKKRRYRTRRFIKANTLGCVCGVWCVVCGVWCVVCGVWCVVCGVWCVHIRWCTMW
jgi:hypothetical protein